MSDPIITAKEFEVLEAFEVALIDHADEGVTAKSVLDEYGSSWSQTSYFNKIAGLVRVGLLKGTLPKGSHRQRYVHGDKYAKIREKLIVKPALLDSRHIKDVKPLSTRPELEERALVNGLPYIPNDELRLHLGKVIEGLEVLKEHVGPALTLLLDLDRDYDRHKKVREHLVALKKDLAGVLS